MITKIRAGVAIAAFCALLFSGCRFAPNRAGAETQAGLANPAAVYCEEQGGEYEIRTADNGSQDGVCLFADGSECDGWAFYRGECAPEPTEPEASATQPVPVAPESLEAESSGAETADPSSDGEGEGISGLANPASVYCEEQGGLLEIRSDEEGNQIGMCVFDDGTECEEWAYFLSECGPGAKHDPTVQAPKLIYGWYGLVLAPDEGESGGYALNLVPETVGTVDLITMGEDVETVLEESAGGSTPVHVWGVLTCDPNSRCGLEVTEALPSDVDETMPSDPVDGWEGTLASLPPMAQFDDVFILSDPNYPVHYGIHAPDLDVAAALDSLRDSGLAFSVFGELTCNVIDVNGCQIRADRIEMTP